MTMLSILRPAYRPRKSLDRKLLTLSQVSPEGSVVDVPHWAKLPKKYEQMKKKIAQLKRRWKQAEKQEPGRRVYKAIFI